MTEDDRGAVDAEGLLQAMAEQAMQETDLRGRSRHAQESEGQQSLRKGAAVSQGAGAYVGRPRLLLPQGYVWIWACLRHAAPHERGACNREWSKTRPSHKAIRQTGAGLRRLPRLTTQRSLSFALWYRSDTKARQSGRAFVLIPYLQAFSEWRDPDSNRGHHDFQSVYVGAALCRYFLTQGLDKRNLCTSRSA
jgi:hypothetical protein